MRSRLMLMALSFGLVFPLTLAANKVLSWPAATAEAAVVVPSRLWTPPEWVEPETAFLLDQLAAAPLRTQGPYVTALGAVVADLDAGVVLWGRDLDEPRAIASVTKLASALTMARVNPAPDLDRSYCVTPELWPIKPGARSRFETGVCHPGWDFLGAALVQSDNRGAMALPWLAEVTYPQFLDAMADTTDALGLDATWQDPTGLGEGNRASPRDVLKLAAVVADHPWLPMVATAPSWSIERSTGLQVLNTTNKLIDTFEPLVAKTGYTDAAGYCFATVVRTASGRRIGAVVLGAPNSRARFDDVARMVRWAEAVPH